MGIPINPSRRAKGIAMHTLLVCVNKQKLRRYEEGEEKNQNCPIRGDQKKPLAKTQ
jgi:hypothetical protein